MAERVTLTLEQAEALQALRAKHDSEKPSSDETCVDTDRRANASAQDHYSPGTPGM